MYSQIAADMMMPEEELESLELQEYIQGTLLKIPEKYRSANCFEIY